MASSKTQYHRELYRQLRDSIDPTGWHILKPGLYRFKGKWIWVSHGDRASYLPELSDNHLSHTITSMIERHPDEFREPLVFEYWKRRLLFKWHPDTAPRKPRGL